MKRLALMILIAMGACLADSCARPMEEKQETTNTPKAEYKKLKAEEYPVPDQLKEALPGLLNDKIRIWREISPTINLVVYSPNYSLDRAIKQAAQAFLILEQNSAITKGNDFWIIQIQPEKGPEVLVWGVRPSEVEQYKKTKDLKDFFANSEYALINDQMIAKGASRLEYLNPGK